MNKTWLKQFKNETLFAILPNGEFFKKTGTPASIELTDSEIALLRGATLRHTHTTSIGGTFSADDISVTVETESPSHTVEATLFNEEYTLERLPTATQESSSRFAEDVAAFERNMMLEAQERIWHAEYEEAGVPIDDAGLRKADHMVKLALHDWLIANSDDYGFRYSFRTR